LGWSMRAAMVARATAHGSERRRLREALEAFPRVARHVFVSYKGTFIQTNQTFMERFEPIWEKAQIPRGIHTMRHTFATDAAKPGF